MEEGKEGKEERERGKGEEREGGVLGKEVMLIKRVWEKTWSLLHLLTGSGVVSSPWNPKVAFALSALPSTSAAKAGLVLLKGRHH